MYVSWGGMFESAWLMSECTIYVWDVYQTPSTGRVSVRTIMRWLKTLSYFTIINFNGWLYNCSNVSLYVPFWQPSIISGYVSPTSAMWEL